MFVVKRNGTKQPVHFDKITSRITKLSWGLISNVEPVLVAQKVCGEIYSGVKTSDLDELAAQIAAGLITVHPDYGKLAARICVSNLHKNTIKSFSQTIEVLHKSRNESLDESFSIIAEDVFEIVKVNANQLDSAIIHDRDYNYDYFGMKTLERSYLQKVDGKIVERPQHMLMRIAVGIHKEDIESALKTYDLLSRGMYTHATPTMFNAGTTNNQLSSCFLLSMTEDSISGIYDTLKRCALISKSAGGIGLAVQNIRSKGAVIRGINGISSGVVPMLRVFNNTARYVNQGGKRKGAFAVYLEPWHSDIFEFLELKFNHGHEESRARDLFYGLWIPDLFMRRVEKDENWSLFNPDKAKNLYVTWGEEFEKHYIRLEAEGRAEKSVKARSLWEVIVRSQIETGTPYMMYKDACNRKSNQKNLGTIRCSNLCTEIVEYSDENEVAVCNLASVSLPRFVRREERKFDHQLLFSVTVEIVKNLNLVIDVTKYPLEEAKTSNLKHRPIGIGVQGLADTFLMLRIPFESDEARLLNRQIFETLYFASLTASNELAMKRGSYSSFKGSPASKGQLQYDMWGVKPTLSIWDWDKLKLNIREHGLYNSLLLAPMPTASTAQILGNNECFEPYTSNVYTRRVLAGEYVCVNKFLVEDLLKLGKWTPEIKNQLIADRGSVQNLSISEELKQLYKCVWEISQKTLIDMAADRGAFIDQSQSLNIYMKEADYSSVTSMHFYGWKKGLKTGMYYLRTKAAADAIQFTVKKKPVVNSQKLKTEHENIEQSFAPEVDKGNEICLVCSS